MVRLKVYAKYPLILRIDLFQFHYGTIKRSQQDYYGTDFVYFNSTMVRLKESSGAQSHEGKLFQFHYGTIKSVGQEPAIELANDISIPLWYD